MWSRPCPRGLLILPLQSGPQEWLFPCLSLTPSASDRPGFPGLLCGVLRLLLGTVGHELSSEGQCSAPFAPHLNSNETLYPGCPAHGHPGPCIGGFK